ncbi:hypothetical protein WG909_12970 [Peptostreptococcaceae bacterium AGR-M142]
MVTKKVYFYKVSMYKEGEIQKKDYYKNLKKEYNSVFKKRLQGNSLDLNNGEKVITMDIINEGDNFIFGTIGHVKDSNGIHFRDYKSLQSSEILSKEDFENKGIEIFTYFFLDYDCGILSIISGQSTPKAEILNNILSKYTDRTLVTEITPIMNPKSAEELLKPNSELCKFSYKMAVPSPDVLGCIPGLNEDENFLGTLIDSDIYEFEILLKSAPRSCISSDENCIKRFIDFFSNNSTNKRKVKFEGKSRGEKQQTYYLNEYPFTSYADINYYKKEGGHKEYFSFKELNQFVENSLYLAYKNKRIDLKRFANR